MIVFLVSAMVIFVLGAVNHPGMDWNKEEFEENKKLARITVFVELQVFYFPRILPYSNHIWEWQKNIFCL